VFQNILVPVDLSEKSPPAILTAIDLADPEKGTIRLLHVVETIRGSEFEEFADFYDKLHEKATKTLEDWAKNLGSTTREIRISVVFGRRSSEIIDFAEEEGCDLIVMTSHKMDEQNPSGGIGTISHHVALLAGCPILLLR
jgi:nucleotide-binding universal stress UspA family protein